MGDFEDTFGVGANAVAIVDAYCSDPNRDIVGRPWVSTGTDSSTTALHEQDFIFPTFKEAAQWARENPGRSITRSPLGDHFVAKNITSKDSLSMKYRTPVTEFDVPF